MKTLSAKAECLPANPQCEGDTACVFVTIKPDLGELLMFDLTPIQARALAAELLNAANDAEKDGKE